MKIKMLVAAAMLFAAVAYASAHSDCVRACQAAFKACQDTEQTTHAANVVACDGSRDCLKAEQERHRDAHKACIDGMKDCKASCRE